MRMVFVGECMVELAPEAGLYRRGFAGDTFNMAWYARKLAPLWQVDYLSAIGTDAVSDEMAAFIAAAGIGTTHLARKASRSVGLYMISLHNGERSFLLLARPVGGASAGRRSRRAGRRLCRCRSDCAVRHHAGDP